MNEHIATSEQQDHKRENEARALALSHITNTAQPLKVAAYENLASISKWLTDVRNYCLDPEPDDARAADWLLDNDYHIARTLRNLKQDLPQDFYNKLPALEQGAEGSIPRVFELAHAIVKSAHSHLNMDSIVSFVCDYQTVSKLTNAELWALPSMLQLCCLEHI